MVVFTWFDACLSSLSLIALSEVVTREMLYHDPRRADSLPVSFTTDGQHEQRANTMFEMESYFTVTV